MSSTLLMVACTTTVTEKTEADQAGLDPTNPMVQLRLQGRIDNIKYQRGTTLIANLERIAAYGDAALEICTENLGNENAMTRMGCVYVLGRIGNPQSVPDMEKLLVDEAKFVRYEAASQLGNLGSRSGYTVLVDGLSDDNIRYRYKCFEALQQLTGRTFDYSHNASPESRKVSVEKWAVWLKQIESEEM
ncbi:MAG: HEAT repeat domain-containing protein [Planctomycetota bacterium]